MPDTEVIKTANSVIGYFERGELRTGSRGAWMTNVGDMVADPYLFALIAWLKEHNKSDAEFWIANGLAKTHLGWPVDQLRATRDRALKLGWIERIVEAAKGRNAVYRWGPAAKGHQ